MALRTLRIARFRREELLRDEDELVVSFSKKLYQVAMHGHNPILNNLLKRIYQVALICLLQQRTSKDLVFRNISSPGLLKLRTIQVAILL